MSCTLGSEFRPNPGAVSPSDCCSLDLANPGDYHTIQAAACILDMLRTILPLLSPLLLVLLLLLAKQKL